MVILDIRRDVSQDDLSLLEWLHHYQIQLIVVLNKADKPPRNQIFSRSKTLSKDLENYRIDKPILFSAKSRQGRDDIWELFEEIILMDDYQTPIKS